MEMSWNFVSPKKWEPWVGDLIFLLCIFDHILISSYPGKFHGNEINFGTSN